MMTAAQPNAMQMLLPVLAAIAVYLLLRFLVFGLLLRVRKKRVAPPIVLLQWLAQLAIGIGIGVGIILATLLVPLAIGHYQVSFLTTASSTGDASSLSYSPLLQPSQALALLGATSLWEEAYFRGCWMLGLALLLGSLSRPVLGKGAFLSLPFQLILWGNAAVLSSALFTLRHLDNPHIGGLAIFNIFLAGLLFGVLLLATHSLTLIWGLHFAWNAALVLPGLPVSGYRLVLRWHLVELTARTSGLTTGGAFGPEASVPLTVVLVILIVLLARMLPARVRALLGGDEKEDQTTPPAEPAASGDE